MTSYKKLHVRMCQCHCVLSQNGAGVTSHKKLHVSMCQYQCILSQNGAGVTSHKKLHVSMCQYHYVLSQNGASLINNESHHMMKSYISTCVSISVNCHRMVQVRPILSHITQLPVKLYLYHCVLPQNVTGLIGNE